MVGVALAGWYHNELQTWYLFWKQFESLGKNDQGYPEYRHRQFGIVMVRVPGGSFTMGSPEGENGRRPDENRHEVTVSPFLIAKYEVTDLLWKRVMGGPPPSIHVFPRDMSPSETDSCPVRAVSWNDCQRFCEKTGLSLPSEAQWEYACRAGSRGLYAGTGKLDEMGWYKENSGLRTRPVGLKKPNAFGLHDMHGNVWEWCRDWYGSYELPVNPGDGERQVPQGGARSRGVRGGSFYSPAEVARSATRSNYTPGSRDSNLGLRPARVITSRLSAAE